MRSLVEDMVIMIQSMLMVSLIDIANFAPVDIFTFFMTLYMFLKMTFLHQNRLTLFFSSINTVLSWNLGALLPLLLSWNSDAFRLWNQLALVLEHHTTLLYWIIDAYLLWLLSLHR